MLCLRFVPQGDFFRDVGPSLPGCFSLTREEPCFWNDRRQPSGASPCPTCLSPERFPTAGSPRPGPRAAAAAVIQALGLQPVRVQVVTPRRAACRRQAGTGKPWYLAHDRRRARAAGHRRRHHRRAGFRRDDVARRALHRPVALDCGPGHDRLRRRRRTDAGRTGRVAAGPRSLHPGDPRRDGRTSHPPAWCMRSPPNKRMPRPISCPRVAAK